MNGSEDCFKREGDGKSNDAGLINDWILDRERLPDESAAPPGVLRSRTWDLVADRVSAWFETEMNAIGRRFNERNGNDFFTTRRVAMFEY